MLYEQMPYYSDRLDVIFKEAYYHPNEYDFDDVSEFAERIVRRYLIHGRSS